MFKYTEVKKERGREKNFTWRSERVSLESLNYKEGWGGRGKGVTTRLSLLHLAHTHLSLLRIVTNWCTKFHQACDY